MLRGPASPGDVGGPRTTAVLARTATGSRDARRRRWCPFNRPAWRQASRCQHAVRLSQHLLRLHRRRATLAAHRRPSQLGLPGSNSARSKSKMSFASSSVNSLSMKATNSSSVIVIRPPSNSEASPSFVSTVMPSASAMDRNCASVISFFCSAMTEKTNRILLWMLPWPVKACTGDKKVSKSIALAGGFCTKPLKNTLSMAGHTR
mmetsp:Transcript_9700/g.34092  ORF Transcript_9700/g.34092 Transcript_9700/m.34092 type:complete len:205 (+) Transcript_9700:165-779(+)